MQYKILYIIFIIFVFTQEIVYSQDEMSDEEIKLENKAFKLFLNKRYEEAKPLFSQLLSLYPKEPDYNYGYGACLVETNQEIPKAIKYLNYAKQKSDNPVIYYYLGLAYHYSYDFKKAISKYKIFKQYALPKEIKTYKVNQKIKECENGLDLVKFISDLIVIDNKKISKNNFYYSYNLSDFGGKLIIEPDEFKSKVDKKKLPKHVMFLPSGLKTFFYTSYGKSKKNSKDIYQRFLNDDGTWSEPVKLGPEINTEYDEDYAFIHPNGKTLYFCSKGRTSMGGYDIFYSKYDSLTQKWSEAKNIDFPINSPFDDILYITDKNQDYAYFASNRETFDNKISVYKILVDKNPIPRPSQDIEEIKTKSKLIVSPIADVKKAEQKKGILIAENKTNQKTKNNNIDNYVPPESSHSYKFDKIKDSPELTNEDLKSELKADVIKVKQSASDTKKDVFLTYLIADSLNKIINKKQNDLKKLKNSNANTKQISKTEKDLQKLQEQLITTYNLAQNLNKTSDIKIKEVEQAMQLADRLNFSDKSKNELIVEINKNRDKLNKNQNKYTSVESEINLRKKNITDKQNKLNKISKNENEVNNDLKNIIAEKIIINNEIKSEKDYNKKQQLKEKLNKLNQEQKDKILIRNKLIKDKQTTITNINSNKNELAILQNIKTNLQNNTNNIDKITADYKKINRQELDNSAYNTELYLDQKNAQDISNIIAENIKSNNYDLEKISTKNQENKPDNKNLISENNNTTTNNNNAKNKEQENKPDNKNLISENNNTTTNNNNAKNKEQENKPDNKKLISENNNSTTNNNNAKNKEQENKPDNKNLISENNNTTTNNNNAKNKEQENKPDNKKLISENNSSSVNNEIATLLQQSNNNKIISDSLANKAKLLQQKLKNTTDDNEKASLQQQIGDLYELSEIKRSQSINQKKQAEEKQKLLAAKSNKQTDKSNEITKDPLFSFNDTQTKNPDLANYEKKYLENIYYENKLKQNNIKLKTLNENIKTIDDFNTKNAINNEISKIEKQNTELKNKITENNNIIKQTEQKLGNATDSINSQNIIYYATNYTSKNINKLSNKEKSEIENQKQEQVKIKEYQTDIAEINNNINQLNKKIAEAKNSNDKTSVKKYQKQINKLKIEKTEKENQYNKKIEEINNNEFKLYSDLIFKTKENISNEQINTANKAENQANLFNEKAKIIRNDINLIDNDSVKNTELKKANLLERIAIQKQKYALDIYLNNKQNVADNNKKQPANSLILLPDEEDALNKSEELNHKAKILEKQANKALTEVAEKEKQANETYSTSKKKKILKNTEKIKTKNQQKLITALKISKQADSLKYNVYKNQINEIKKSSKNSKNILIAEQYNRKADLFYNKAQELREQANNYPDINDKINILKKAHKLEQKSLTNQSLAVDILLQTEPVTFVASNSLVKINNLQANNNTVVNVDDIKKYKTKKIIENLNLDDNELKNLDDAKAQENNAIKLINDADSLQKQINKLNTKINNSNDEKQAKKDKKKIEKLKKQMFELKFTAAEAFETVNNIRYYTYKDNIKKIRTNSKQAKQLEKNSRINFNKAKNLRDKAFFIDDPVKAYKLTTQAMQLEKTGIEDIEKAIGLYLNLPSENETAKILAEKNKNTTDINNYNILENKNADITPINTDSLITANNKTTADTTTNNYNNNIITENKNTNNTNNNNITDNKNTDITPTNTDSLITANNKTTADTTTNNYNNNIIAENKNTNNTNNNNITDNKNTDNSTTDTNNLITDNKTDNSNNTNNNNIITENTNNNYTTTNTQAKYNLQYSISEVSAYSNENPIPINPTLPNGIIFKVQVGAFKTKIRQDAFKGLSPIVGEKLPNSSFTKYLAGLFYSLEGSRIALKEIKSMGYRDAFIVAYKDGKRIPIYKAKSYLQQQTDYNTLAQNEVDKIKNRTTQTTQTSSQTTNTKNTIQAKTNYTSVKTIPDLFYTVQIGVYKKPVTPKQLHNISPIYQDKTPYGFIRYTTGIFSDKKTANIEKNRIVKLGISDAFVTAYYKGKKLTNQELTNLLKTNVNFAKQQNIKLPEAPITKQPEIDAKNANIIFKVQIGAYKENVPTSTVTAMLSVARKKQLNSYKENGKTIYTVGNYKEYKQAVEMRDIIKNEGINDAFIVAYNNNKKISVEQAISILKK